MRKILLFAATLLLSISLFAQQEKGYVYLKNGTILKGKYQYSTDLKKLKVETAENIRVFEIAEIDSVVSNRIERTNQFQTSNLTTFFRTEIGLLAGNSDNNRSAPLSFTGSYNFPVIENFSAGAGIGLEFFNESYLPVFVSAEYKLRNTKSTPYFFVLAGYQVPLEDSRTSYYYDYYPSWSSIWPGPTYPENYDPKGGILLNPGIGYMHLFSPDFGMSVAFGYRYHRLNYKGDEDYELYIDYNRLSIKLGIIFK
jgi:hypothetical protein